MDTTDLECTVAFFFALGAFTTGHIILTAIAIAFIIVRVKF